MLVLLSAVVSHYYNCCTDGSTSPGNYGYRLVCLACRILCRILGSHSYEYEELHLLRHYIV
jgi:hypothetical protein